MKQEQRAVATPLYELLENVPPKTRLVVDDEDGMGTSFIPVGRLCHEAAAALRQLLEQPEQSEVVVVSNGHVSPLMTHMMNKRAKSNIKQVIELYDAQPAQPADWVGLTPTERKEIERQSVYVESAIRMTDAKLREKNGGKADQTKLKDLT